MCVLLCGFPFCIGFGTKTELMPRRWAVQLYFIPISVSHTLCVFVCVCGGGKQLSWLEFGFESSPRLSWGHQARPSASL